MWESLLHIRWWRILVNYFFKLKVTISLFNVGKSVTRVLPSIPSTPFAFKLLAFFTSFVLVFFFVCSFRSKLAKVTLMFFGTPPEWFLYLLWNLVLFNFHFRRLDNEIFPQNRRDAAENAFGNRTSAALGMVKSLAEFSVPNVAPSPSHFPPQLHRIFFYTFQQWSLKTRSFYLPI